MKGSFILLDFEAVGTDQPVEMAAIGWNHLTGKAFWSWCIISPWDKVDVENFLYKAQIGIHGLTTQKVKEWGFSEKQALHSLEYFLRLFPDDVKILARNPGLENRILDRWNKFMGFPLFPQAEEVLLHFQLFHFYHKRHRPPDLILFASRYDCKQHGSGTHCAIADVIFLWLCWKRYVENKSALV